MLIKMRKGSLAPKLIQHHFLSLKWTLDILKKQNLEPESTRPELRMMEVSLMVILRNSLK